ncbi:MAG: hypothetical protein ACOH2A_09635 [Sphingobacteriaceae bacterium]
MKKLSFLLFFAITLFLFSNANAQTVKTSVKKSSKKSVVKPAKDVVATSKSKQHSKTVTFPPPVRVGKVKTGKNQKQTPPPPPAPPTAPPPPPAAPVN